MIKINISTMLVVREPIPANLIGLTDYTLRNLQTELNPVPDALVDVEYWPEIGGATLYDSETQRLGSEILTANVPDKSVIITHEVVALTAQEIADNLSSAKAAKEFELIALANASEKSGVIVDGNAIGTAPESVSSTTSALSLMGRNPVETIPVRTVGGAWMAGNKAGLEAIQNAMWTHIKATSENEKLHSDAINALTTIQAVADYDISIGWP